MITDIRRIAFCFGLALAAFSAPIYNSGQFIIRQGNIELDRQGKSIYLEDFKNGIDAWKIDNYENALAFSQKEVKGEPVLYVTNLIKDRDTAWELISPRAAVTPGTTLTIRTKTTGAYSLENPVPCKTSYFNAIFWYDANDRQIPGYDLFTISPSPDSWLGTENNFQVPPKAAKAEIHFGADAPNIKLGEFFAISEVELLEKNNKHTCVNRQSFESGIKFIADKRPALSWKADCPGKSSVSFQISTAPDNNGIPGKWTPFAGPDGSAKSSYSKPSTIKAPDGHTWYKYKCTLTADGTRSPSLASVTIGSQTDSNWTIGNTMEPQVRLITSTPNQNPKVPVSIGIQAGAPVDLRSFAVNLDGKEITSAVRHSREADEERFTYMPDAPYEHIYTPSTPWLWDISNSRDHLALTHIEDNPNAMHVQSRYDVKKDTYVALNSQYRPVTPGENYSISFKIRHNLNLESTSGAFGTIEWIDSNLAKTGNAQPITIPTSPVDEWTNVTITATAPAGAAYTRVRLLIDKPDLIGKDYFEIDDLQFTGTLPKGVKSPSPNLHQIRVTGKDMDGNSFDEELYFCIGEPLAKNIATMRDDGTILIDGKPFFPIGLYGISKKEFNQNSYDIAFRDLAANGFNFAQSYTVRRGVDFEEYMAAAEKHGIKIWSWPSSDYPKTFAADAKRPCILAWYLGDDTSSYATPKGVQRRHRILHAIDNAHLTTQADSVGSFATMYEPFVHSTDTFLPEIYPVRKATPDKTEVSEVILDMKAIRNSFTKHGSPTKSIWTIIQYFDGWSLWHRYPTRDELYAMSYLSIIYGARGITWYSYGGDGKKSFGVTYTPEKWADICGLAKQISQISDKLTARDAAIQPVPVILEGPTVDLCKESSLHCLLKDSQGKKLLLTASSSTEEVKAIIPVKGFKTANAIFEGRKLDATNGITETFKPYAVHVFELE